MLNPWCETNSAWHNRHSCVELLKDIKLVLKIIKHEKHKKNFNFGNQKI